MKINYKEELVSAAKNMILVHDPNTLIKMVVRRIVQKVKVSHAGILLYKKDKNTFVLTISRGNLGLKIPEGFARMDFDNPMIRYFREHNKKGASSHNSLLFSELEKKIKKEQGRASSLFLKKVLYQMEIYQSVACVPSYYGKDLMAVLLLGEKNNGKKFVKGELDFFSALASDVAMAIRNAQLFQDLENELEKKYRLFIHAVIALVSAIDAKDHYTHGHTERVTNLSLLIARKLRQKNKKAIDSRFLDQLYIAGLLHDIGKIGVPENILNKNGPLTFEERGKMIDHVNLGATILEPIDELEDAILGVKYHHERCDGTGYPEGLKCAEIPLIARIISVADTFDAMSTDRPYRKSLNKLEAIDEIRRVSGKQLDPECSQALVELYEEGKI